MKTHERVLAFAALFSVIALAAVTGVSHARRASLSDESTAAEYRAMALESKDDAGELNGAFVTSSINTEDRLNSAGNSFNNKAALIQFASQSDYDTILGLLEVAASELDDALEANDYAIGWFGEGDYWVNDGDFQCLGQEWLDAIDSYHEADLAYGEALDLESFAIGGLSEADSAIDSVNAILGKY